MSSQQAPRVIDATELEARVPMRDAIEFMRAALLAEVPSAPERMVVEVGERGQLLVMPAVGDRAVGVKVLGLMPDNPGRGSPYIQGSFILLDARTLSPRAIVDGAALTRRRTAALSGVATDLLARPDATTLVMFGAGAQARAHVEAVAAVRAISEVIVIDQSTNAASALIAEADSRGLAARAGRPDDVAAADVICTCTTSSHPVFQGRRLKPGVHINAIGAFEPHARELDDDTFADALVVLDDQAAVMSKAGDILLALASGALVRELIAGELRELVAGRVRRETPEQRTIYKSVGVAYQDLMLAQEIDVGLTSHLHDPRA